MGMGDRAGVIWWSRKEGWVGAERTAKREGGEAWGGREGGEAWGGREGGEAWGVGESRVRVRDSGNKAHRNRAGVDQGHGGAEESEERGDRQLLCPWGAGWVIPGPSRRPQHHLR